jgi:hypothetical protein
MALSKIDSDGIVSGGITADSLNIGQIGGRRNLIINGAMQVWQRSTSSVTISDNSNEGYANVDRYSMIFGGSAGGAVVWSKSTDAPDGFNNSLKVACSTTTTTTGSQEIAIRTQLEGQDLQALAYGGTSPKTATLSFWFKTNKVGLYSVYLQTSGTGTRRRYFTFTPAASDTWERIEIQISGDSVAIPDTNGYGLMVSLFLANTPNYDDAASSTDWGTVIKINSSSNVNFMDSTSNELYITGVQLEVGSVATPFEHRSYGEELAACQRYYYEYSDRWVAFGFASAALQWMYVRFTFPTTMRTAPSVTYDQGTVYGSGNSASPSSVTNDSFYWQLKASAANNDIAAGGTSLTASAEL